MPDVDLTNRMLELLIKQAETSRETNILLANLERNQLELNNQIVELLEKLDILKDAVDKITAKLERLQSK